MLTLTTNEQDWLEEYKRILREKYPDILKDIIVYGSKARGDAKTDSDLDILVLISDGDRALKDEISSAGFDYEIEKGILPVVHVFTENEWKHLEELESLFRDSVEEEGISVI